MKSNTLYHGQLPGDPNILNKNNKMTISQVFLSNRINPLSPNSDQHQISLYHIMHHNTYRS